MVKDTLRDLFPVLFPATWRRHPENPLYRYVCYDRLRLLNPSPNWLRDILWIIEQTGLKDEDELKQHFHTVRDAAWQLVQEFTIARWWFLRSIMAKTSYYDEVRDMARDGATIVDLGCGFGQELRRLRADGATGELYGVDLREDMWSFGLRLLNDWDDKEWAGQFRKADIISRYDNENPLAEFADKTDVFLLNDVVSFWGPNISGVLDSIDMVSRVGTKVIGWMIGQEGDENLNGMQVYGDGLLRGCIPTMSVFKALFSMSNVHPDIKWNIEARLVEFEKLGFDEEDQEWFTSEFFNPPLSIAGAPNELKALCFLATRIH